MSAQHTPGPWAYRVVGSSHDEQSVVYCLIGPKATIGKMGGVAYSGTYGKNRKLETSGIRQTDAECEANARLIAAAPVLLEALAAYLAAKPQCKCSDNSGCEMATARVKARAALALATPLSDTPIALERTDE